MSGFGGRTTLYPSQLSMPTNMQAEPVRAEMARSVWSGAEKMHRRDEWICKIRIFLVEISVIC